MTCTCFCYVKIQAMTVLLDESNSKFLWAVFLSGGDIATAMTPSSRSMGSGGVAEAPCHAPRSQTGAT
jgi:hypothetical protein